ncbi:DUF5681 domain-containing protein [Caballeronia sp. LjRoot34]|uniref:DUF5681 domain-containing protein n=1 Tax=Caballeronia sp. LjRoot34 TaxID=3342325 RepID=UPI003ECD044E
MARFLPGQSGNPGGKPLSAKRLREVLELDIDLYAAKLKELALAGEPTALKLVIERLCPAPKPGRDAVQIPTLYHAETFTDKANALLDAVARGDLSPEDGATLLTSLSGAVRTTELDDLIRRLDALEGPKKPTVDGADLL